MVRFSRVGLACWRICYSQVIGSWPCMTQHGGNPLQFQAHSEGRRPPTTKSDGMCTFSVGRSWEAKKLATRIGAIKYFICAYNLTKATAFLGYHSPSVCLG